MYYKCCKIDSHSSATNFGFDKKLKIDFPVCTIYSMRIAICISRTAIYRDAVLVGDTQPYREADLRLCFRLCRLLVFPSGGSFYKLFSFTLPSILKLYQPILVLPISG